MWKYSDQKQCNEFLLSLHLIDEKNSKKYIKELYSIANNIENNYTIHRIKKRNGSSRTIYQPSPTLKHIQRQILKNILNNKEISKYAKAYHNNISLVDNAKPHINKDIILKLDIKHFFDSISFMQIYSSCFSIEYFPKSIGHLLTYLCTYNNYLPQGSPAAAYISNLVMKEFDEELGAWCESDDITYTRYSDDMTFSGNFNPSLIIKKVRKMLYSLNMKLNNGKICVIKKSQRQCVTGIIVNEKINLSKQYRDRIRQEIYYIKKYGLESHLNKLNLDKTSYLNNLYGRILFVIQINSKKKNFIDYKNYILQLMNNGASDINV